MFRVRGASRLRGFGFFGASNLINGILDGRLVTGSFKETYYKVSDRDLVVQGLGLVKG